MLIIEPAPSSCGWVLPSQMIVKAVVHLWYAKFTWQSFHCTSYCSAFLVVPHRIFGLCMFPLFVQWNPGDLTALHQMLYCCPNSEKNVPWTLYRWQIITWYHQALVWAYCYYQTQVKNTIYLFFIKGESSIKYSIFFFTWMIIKKFKKSWPIT